MNTTPQFWRPPTASILAYRSALRVLMVAGTVAAAACGGQQTPSRAATVVQQPTPSLSDAEIRDLDIAFYSERAQGDPTGALDLAHLGSLYLARGRETGDPRDAELAEGAARRSLNNRSARNEQAAQVLQASLLSQHRFDEALAIAIAARDADPDNAALRASVGDIQMELGQYDAARVSFSNLHVALGDLSVGPRLARWAEIEGQPEKARRILAAVVKNARREVKMPRERMAWYWLRVGDVELRMGNLRGADSAYRAGMAVHPEDYRLLSALAHSAALQQKWPAAIAFGERAIAQTLDPATLGTLSDAYTAIGDSAKSAEYQRVLDVVVLKQPGAYHRAWSLFLLDHDRHIATVSRKVREELRTRKDVYAYDLLAWTLHKQGRHQEASSAMQLALRMGTKDPQLVRHAEAIERALGPSAAGQP